MVDSVEYLAKIYQSLLIKITFIHILVLLFIYGTYLQLFVL